MNERTKPAGAGGRDNSRILVVDDQEDNALLLGQYLLSEGYSIDIAASGEEALRLLDERAPALVLLDVVMPGMDGFHVCREIKARERSALTPVVLVTALDSRDDRIAGIEAGADEFLSKPVNREELLARVRSLLRLQATRCQLEEARLANETAKRERMRATFERYVSPKLVEAILSQPERSDELLMDRNNRLDATILFADMRGFTRLSDQCAPETVVSLLNEYFTSLTEIAFRYDGTIFNMAGDSLLVGFGVPLAQADGPLRALCTARDMQREFAELSRRWSREHGVHAGLGVGINHGDVIVGNVGSPSYMSYTVIGDAVNTASRITHLAHAGEVKVAESVKEVCGPLDSSSVRFRPESRTILKGKIRWQNVYRVDFGDGDDLERSLVTPQEAQAAMS